MPKVKTHQGTAKRIKKTKTGKLISRTAGQDHFNSRESSKATKNKRRDLVLHKSHNKLKALNSLQVKQANQQSANQQSADTLIY